LARCRWLPLLHFHTCDFVPGSRLQFKTASTRSRKKLPLRRAAFPGKAKKKAPRSQDERRAPEKAVLAIKSNSSRWANDQGNKFAWQQGYAAFSVSSSLVPKVVRYIQSQESHHRKMTFDPELLALLKKHGVEFDPKFVFG
jgi:Transposase IS200 like